MIILTSFYSIFLLLTGIFGATSAMTEDLTLHRPQNADASTSAELHDIMGPVTMAEPNNWPLLLGAIFSIITLLFILLWWKKRTPKVHFISPREQALNDLNHLYSQIDAPAQYIEEISNIVRLYIRAEYTIPCPQRASQEFLISLNDSALAKQSELLKTFFLFWDAVKFSGLQPSAEELKKHLEDVERFIRGGDDALSAP